MRSIEFHVAGRVQGVWFRESTRRRAQELHLTGWVRNLPDGRVQGRAFGAEAAIDRLIEWLHEGPEQASVTSVEVAEIVAQAPEGFEVVR